MLGRNIGLGAAAIVCLFTLSAKAGENETRSHSVIIVASPSILPEGARCRIELQPESIAESEELDRIPYVRRSFKDTGIASPTIYEGTIKEITKDKVLLTAASIEHRCINTSPLSRVPYVKRYYKNTGVPPQALEEEEVQVPIEKIRSITLIEEAKPRGSAQSGSRRPESDPSRK